MNFFRRLFQRPTSSPMNAIGSGVNYDEFYGYHDEKCWSKVELKQQDEFCYLLRFTWKNKLDPERSLRFFHVVQNVDPDGLASFSEFDPTGDDGPTEFFQGKTDDLCFNLYRPYDDAEAVGIDIHFAKPNPGKLTRLQQTLWRYTPEQTNKQTNKQKDICVSDSSGYRPRA